MRAMLVVVLLSAGIVVGPVHAQASVDAKTRAELEQARDVVWRSWFAGDSVTLDRVIAPALAAGDSDGDWSDKRRAIADSREFAKAGGKLIDLKFDSTVIQLRGKVAVMTSRYSFTVMDAGGGTPKTTRGVAVEIFVHEKGMWTHPFWHLTR